MKIYIKLTIALLLCLTGSSMYAQTAEELRNQAAAYKRSAFEAYNVFFNTSLSDAERLKAISPYVTPVDEKQKIKCASVAEDKKESDAIRAAALGTTVLYPAYDSVLFHGILEWIKNEKLPLLRTAALNSIRFIEFESSEYSGVGLQISEAAKSLMKDRDHNFRLVAYGILAGNQDNYTLDLLLQNINKKDESQLTIDESLELLNVYEKKSNEMYVAVNNLFNDNAISAATKIECIDMLTGYKPATDKIVAVYQNSKEPYELRKTALVSLSASQKEKLQDYISPVIFNERENEDIRTVSLNVVTYLHQSGWYRSRFKKLSKFSEDVKNLSNTTSSSSVKSLADYYVLNVNTKY